ncbi:hypothetical protein Tco_0561438 [Tanacetum coccineum]
MLAPKCATYNGRLTFTNPCTVKKAQSEKSRLYEYSIRYLQILKQISPDTEETMTLDNESRSKLNKDYVKPYDYYKTKQSYEIFKAPSTGVSLSVMETRKEVRNTMWRKPFVRTKPNIAKNVAFLPVSESISKSRQVFNDMTFNINHFRTICDQAWFKHTSDYFQVPTAKDMEVLIKTLLMPLSIKSQNDSFHFEHELKMEMHEDFEYVKSLENEVDELESEKADFSNMYDLLIEECFKECKCLAQKLSKQTESVNKEVHNKLLKSFAKLENHSISLELSLQQCKEQMKNNSVCKENGSNVFRKEHEQYHEIQDLKAQMQDKNIAISELKKLIEKCKGKSVETQFDKPSNKDAKSHKTTKRYMPVEKSSASKKPERQIPTGHRWIPTGKLRNSCTGKVESEPTYGSIVDISHIHGKQNNTQTIVVNSTTESEYVAAASCYGQVLWIQNQMLDYGYNFMNTKIFIDNESIICIVKNSVFHSKTKHIEIRHHFIRDSNEKKLIQMIKIHTDQNVIDLLIKAFDVGRFQYLIATEYAQMMLETAVDDAIQVSTVGLTYYWYALTENPTIYVSLIQQFWNTTTARTLDNGEMEITAIIDGKIKIVSEASIRRHLKLEDYESISNLPTTKIFEQLAFMGVVQGEGSTVLVESHHTPTNALSTSQLPSSSHSRRTTRQEFVVLQPKSPTQTNVADKAASIGMDVRHRGAATTVTSLDAGQGSGSIDKTPSMPYNSPLPRVHTLASDEGRMQHNELMDLVTKLSGRVVKKLEKTVKTRQTRRKARIVVSDDEEYLKDPSKQGRKERHDKESDFEFTAAEEVYTTEKGVSTAEPVSTAGASVSTAGASLAKDKGYRLKLIKKKGRGFPEYKKKQALSTLKNRMKFKLELKLMKSLHKDYNQRKERGTLKLKKQDCLQSLSMRERDTLLHKELKKGETSHLHKLNRGLTCLNISRTWESESERVIPELAAGSSKRDAEEEIVQESPKRLKTRDNLVSVEEPKNKEEEEELSQERIQQMMIIVPEQAK